VATALRREGEKRVGVGGNAPWRMKKERRRLSKEHKKKQENAPLGRAFPRQTESKREAGGGEISFEDTPGGRENEKNRLKKERI